LSAQDDGYRFVAYIVQSHGARVAISDPISQSRNAVGDSIPFLTMRAAVKGDRVMTFLTSPAGMGNPTQAKPESALLTSVETGVIGEVLSTSVDGYSYSAYIVESLGSRVVVADIAGANPYRVGDQITFVARRLPNPRTPDHGMLSFATDREAGSDADNRPEGLRVSITNDTATVDEVLTTQLDHYRSVAYVVK
jgi:hypothetical protein